MRESAVQISDTPVHELVILKLLFLLLWPRSGSIALRRLILLHCVGK